MELAEIARKMGLWPRLVRYVFDHHLIPGISGDGRGVIRDLTLNEAVGIASAAMLLESGVKRNTVRTCFDMLTSSGVWPLDQAIRPDHHWIEIANGWYVRILGEDNPRGSWQPLGGGTLVKSIPEPAVLIRVNLALIRAKLSA